jgi:hypothetical protein
VLTFPGPQRGRERALIMGTTLICAVPPSRAVFAGQRVDSGVRRDQLECLFKGGCEGSNPSASITGDGRGGLTGSALDGPSGGHQRSAGRGDGLCRRPLYGPLCVGGGAGRCARCVPAASTGDHGLAAKLHVSKPTCEVAPAPSQGGSAGSNPVGATTIGRRLAADWPSIGVGGWSARSLPVIFCAGRCRICRSACGQSPGQVQSGLWMAGNGLRPRWWR